MIPLRDTIPSRIFPIINVLLIIFNIIIFLYELSLGKEVGILLHRFGVIPKEFFLNFNSQNYFSAFFPLLTSIFLHGGWFHLIGNMLFLWIFGDNVEDRIGHLRYLIFYLLCGVSAGLIHIYTNPNSALPTVGASGAIAGILGAYFLCFPRSKILTLVPIGFLLQIIKLPAFLFLGFWFLIQFIQGSIQLSLSPGDVGGVAWWAHIGGFITGMVFIIFFKIAR